MPDIIYTPSLFVGAFNQVAEASFGSVILEGEIANFKISKNRWVYFDLKDESASLRCFGAVYMLPGPLQDGLSVRLRGQPRLHAQFGFSINLQAIVPVGEGSLRKAAQLLFEMLQKEGLFAAERKRTLPTAPETIALITSAESAAFADFIKILNERWGGVQVSLLDVQVQGESAPAQIEAAINYFNRHGADEEVLVITRGGGSADDLAAFSDERVVRAIAASRIPTLVAIGHEVDESLAELAADARASTPSNAAQILVPDKQHVRVQLQLLAENLDNKITQQIFDLRREAGLAANDTDHLILEILENYRRQMSQSSRLLDVLDPRAALLRGYALVRDGNRQLIRSAGQVGAGQDITISWHDGTIHAKAGK